MSMKKSILILTKSLFITITVLAQTNNLVVAAQNYTNGKDNAASFGINIPVGEFSKTHFGRIALDYSWSYHRFGTLQALPKMLIGFTANGGIDYYFGR